MKEDIDTSALTDFLIKNPDTVTVLKQMDDDDEEDEDEGAKSNTNEGERMEE